MQSIPEITPEAFPVLSRLRLDDEEIVALCQQGTLCAERRGTKKVFRLRYRVHGRQRVRYVSPHETAALESELGALQKSLRAQRHMKRIAQTAREALQKHKSSLGPLLEKRGCYFHGHQVRRRRNRRMKTATLV